jgi:hypothetical protein
VRARATNPGGAPAVAVKPLVVRVNCAARVGQRASVQVKVVPRACRRRSSREPHVRPQQQAAGGSGRRLTAPAVNQNHGGSAQAAVALEHELHAVVCEYARLAIAGHRGLQRGFAWKQLQQGLHQSNRHWMAPNQCYGRRREGPSLPCRFHHSRQSSRRQPSAACSSLLGSPMPPGSCSIPTQHMLQAIKSGTSSKGPGCNVTDAGVGRQRRRRSRSLRRGRCTQQRQTQQGDAGRGAMNRGG